MPSLAEAAPILRGGLLVQLVVGLVCLLAIAGLCFLRRGAARFWMGPAMVALVVLPGVTASGITLLSFRQAMTAMALIGSGGVAAIAAGAAEALVALMAGLATVAGLALVALRATLVGSSGGGEDDESGLALPAVAVAAFLLAAGLIAQVWGLIGTVSAGPVDATALFNRWRLCALVSGALTLLLPLLAVVTALRAPRGGAPFVVKLAVVGTLSLAGLGALAGLGVVFNEVRCLTRAAYSGVPCHEGPR